MSVLLPRIGVTECSRAISLLENHLDNVVGTFWVMNGYGNEEPNIPGWWTDIVSEENQAQVILDAYNRGAFDGEHDNPLYLGFCIIVVASKDNPADFSYVVQHLRMADFEGIRLIEILAKENIPAHTEVTYPMDFLSIRYRYQEENFLRRLKDLRGWGVELWEDYCSYLVANHGQNMTNDYWSKSQTL